MRTSKDIIPDSELEIYFLGTNFGGACHRALLHASILKVAVGYHCGWTITDIMRRMALISNKGTVLKRGRQLLRAIPELHEFMLNSG